MIPRTPLSAAVLAGTLSMALGMPALAQESAGFIDGSSATLNLRNFYINRNFVDPLY
ncbi:MAG TPA: outer membrane porin, OprD family, partial [Pseudomonas sp.]|nr:outer membrane porin, OprD family [Pseudomonas sp.]